MPLNDVYVITDRQRWAGGEEIINVYTYHKEVEAETAETMSGMFNDIMLSKLRLFQHGNMKHEEIEVVNLGDPTDFHVRTLANVAGNEIGEALPIFNSLNFTLRAGDRRIRPGSKRISGLTEAQHANGVITAAITLGQIEAFRAALAAPWETVPGVPRAVPVIVKRVAYTAPSGKPAYRWPTSDAELVLAPVIGCLVNLQISHQVSRGNAR